MFNLVFLIIPWKLGFGGPLVGPCCYKKDVGNISYTLVSSEDSSIASTYGCKSNCVYEQDDLPGSKFCFAVGDLPTSCKESLEENNSLLTKSPEENTSLLTESPEGPCDNGLCNQGVLITGGNPTYQSSQLFVPATGKFCQLKDLPDDRHRHTLNNLVVCGSAIVGPEQNSCLQFEITFPHGSWTEYGTTEVEFFDATGFASEGKVLLLGGGQSSGTTAEIVGEGAQFNTTRISSACGITDGASIVVTGGYTRGKTVERYNLEGLIETLPDLLESRFYHGCGVYTDQSNIKTYVVAGGAYAPQASTEVLTVGGDTWSFAASLPRGLYAPASASLENSILFIGGDDGASSTMGSPRAEILEFDGTGWQQVGMMEEPRSTAAAQAYDLASFKPLNLTNCT